MRYKVKGNIHLWGWVNFKNAIKGVLVDYKVDGNITYWKEFETDVDAKIVENIIMEYGLTLCNNEIFNVEKSNNIQNNNEPMTFYKMSVEKQESLTNWINNNFVKIKTVYKNRTSSELKELFKEFSVTNGEFKGAMDKCGFKYEVKDNINWYFNISKKSPVFSLL